MYCNDPTHDKKVGTGLKKSSENKALGRFVIEQ